ncbi:CocE/NonD family hydrolase [Actinospica robiniae]|uniref:CocE/NonD family hydrolase n=1 Tax=Actinospica robiniae TaxID=304901 RepID=UPI0003F90B17|nr:CocE/NonD family hydrolase [Actinospica robiniae]
MPVHGRTRRRRSPSLLGAAALVLPALLTAAPPASAASAAVSTTALTLTMPDGTGLTAELTRPSGSGPHPAIVFIDSWATPDFEYLLQAQQFAADGYIVLEYDPRGFYSSGGSIDVAGPQDVADVSSVISWLLANTSANPAEIGVGGVSYGAGLSLLAAGHDPRIKAVAAMSAWTDLDYSLYPNSTRHQESTDLLAAAAELTGTLSPDFQNILDDFYGDTDISDVLSWGAVRSPQTYVDSINANGAAVFISNGLQDSIFAPNQLLPFYNDLSTPKYLMLQPGDHATSEASGLLGLDNTVWDHAHAWFDHYLTGAANGIDTQAPVQVEPIGGSSYQGYASPAAMTASSTTYQLGAKNWLGTGSLSTGAAGSFTTKTNAGTASCAAGGTLEVSGILTQFFDAPPSCWLPAINRSDDAVWQSSALSATDHVRGTASLNLTVTPSASSGTLYAYLYDVDLLDDGTLISYLPYSYSGATPGKPLQISAQFLTTSYDIPAGDSVALVLGTKDPLFLDADQSGSTVAFGGPSSLTLPLGR